MAQIPGYQRSFKVIGFFLILLASEFKHNISSDPTESEVVVGVTHTKGIVCFLTFEKYSLMAYAIDDWKKYISLSFHSYCKFKRKTLLSRDHGIHSKPDIPEALLLRFLILQTILCGHQHHLEGWLNH